MLTVTPKANFTLAPFNRESFSTAAPIRNAQAKGKDTTGMVELHLKDEFNTVIFCETKDEAKRVKPVYKKHLENMGRKPDKILLRQGADSEVIKNTPNP